jgi:hypothetical protein
MMYFPLIPMGKERVRDRFTSFVGHDPERKSVSALNRDELGEQLDGLRGQLQLYELDEATERRVRAAIDRSRTEESVDALREQFRAILKMVNAY